MIYSVCQPAKRSGKTEVIRSFIKKNPDLKFLILTPKDEQRMKDVGVIEENMVICYERV